MVGLFIDLHTVFLNICRTCGHRDREQDRFLVVVTMNSHSYAPEQYLHRNGIHMCSLQYIRAKLLHWNIGLCQSAILMDVSCPSMCHSLSKGKPRFCGQSASGLQSSATLQPRALQIAASPHLGILCANNLKHTLHCIGRYLSTLAFLFFFSTLFSAETTFAAIFQNRLEYI
jgi:hypothetical protein